MLTTHQLQKWRCLHRSGMPKGPGGQEEVVLSPANLVEEEERTSCARASHPNPSLPAVGRWKSHVKDTEK